jgi:hypothetical protein
VQYGEEVPCCDVCHRERETEVFASGLGPASFAYCNECVAKDAEPLMMVATAIFHLGGVENTDLTELQGITTFAEGLYRNLDYARQVYPDLEDTVRRVFFGDFQD